MPCLGACVALGSPVLFELDGPLMTAFKEVRSGDCSAYAIKDYFDAPNCCPAGSPAGNDYAHPAPFLFGMQPEL